MTDLWDAEATIRAALVTRVQTVTDIGNVYNHFKFCDDWQNYKSLFGFTPTGATVPVVRTWFVSCEAIPIIGQVSAGAFGAGIQSTLDYRIKGFIGMVETGSEQAGLVLAIKVQKALNNNATLAATAYSAGLAQLTSYQYATWGGVTCHSAEISMPFHLNF